MAHSPASSSSSSDQPLVAPGPLIDGASTDLLLYTGTQLASSPILLPLYDLINRAFHLSMPWFHTDRLQTPEGIVHELDHGNDFITYVVASIAPLPPGNARTRRPPTLYATVSARPVGPKDLTDWNPCPGSSCTATPPTPDPAVVGWELKMLAVDPAVMRRGLSGWLLPALEAEIRRRVAETARPDTRVRMLLSTLKEQNYDYYLRRGYAFVKEEWCEEGTFGAHTGFHLVYMEKMLSP